MSSEANPEISPEVPSPCQHCCRVQAGSELCRGCWRTREEIRQWREMGAAERRKVLLRAARRRFEESAGEVPQRGLAG